MLDVEDHLLPETAAIRSAVRPVRSGTHIITISNARNAEMPPVKSVIILYRAVRLIAQTLSGILDIKSV